MIFLSRKHYFLRQIYIYCIFILGLIITSIITYHATAKVFDFLSISKNEDFMYKRLVVEKGDTLWDIANKSNLNMDTRIVINNIVKRNSLKETIIHPEQVIYIPVERSNHRIAPELASTEDKL